MNEITILAQIKDEPLALALFGAIVLLKLIELFGKHGANFIRIIFGKEKRKSVEELYAEDAEERKKRQAEIDSKLDAMDTEIKNIFSLIADNEELTKDVSRGTLENMLCNENVTPLRRLKAYRRLIGQGANGVLKKIGFALILDYKDLWLEVLYSRIDFEIVDQNFWDKTMDEIRRNIFGGVM